MNRRLFCAMLAGGCAVVQSQEKPSPEGMRLYLIDLLLKAQPKDHFFFPIDDFNMELVFIKKRMLLLGSKNDMVLTCPVEVIFLKDVNLETAYQFVQQGKYKFSK